MTCKKKVVEKLQYLGIAKKTTKVVITIFSAIQERTRFQRFQRSWDMLPRSQYTYCCNLTHDTFIFTYTIPISSVNELNSAGLRKNATTCSKMKYNRSEIIRSSLQIPRNLRSSGRNVLRKKLFRMSTLTTYSKRWDASCSVCYSVRIHGKYMDRDSCSLHRALPCVHRR